MALYVLEAINLDFFVLMLIYFFVLSFSDPSDPRIKDPSFAEPGQKLRKCYGCMAQVLEDSHHCNTCKRCVNNFDHHCFFLNNCIGGQNYRNFLALLAWITIHMALGMSIGLVIFLEVSNWERWLALTDVILQFIVFAEVAVLGLFHCYLGLCLYQTTL